MRGHDATVFGCASGASLSDHISRPSSPLSATGQNSPVDTQGEERTIAERRANNNDLEKLYGNPSPYSYTRGLSRRKIIIPVRRNEDRSRGWPVMKLDACQKQIANIFVVSPFSLSLSVGIFTIAIRHSNVTFLCVFFHGFTKDAKRFSTLYWRQLKKISTLWSSCCLDAVIACGNCLCNEDLSRRTYLTPITSETS